MKTNLTILTLVCTLLSGPAAAQQPQTSGSYALVPTVPAADAAHFSMHLGDGETELDQTVGSGLEEFADSCDGGCACSSCGGLNLLGRTFASAEFMHWYSKGRSLPPLVTTSPQGTAAAQAGVLGFPATEILFGGRDYGSDRQAGGRAAIGIWMDEGGERALMLRGFGAEGRSVLFSASSTGNPILARPFFNDDPLVNAQDSLIVALVGVAQSGNINIKNEHDVFGGQLTARALLDCGCNYRLDLVGGYRYDRIDDDLLISTFVDTGANTFTYNDLFEVNNEFHGGELGVLGEFYRNCWTVSFLGKVALGNMKQEVLINGEHIITGGGATQGAGGLLTQPTNINTFERDELTWVPEANFKLSYAVTEQLSITVGYSFMYWTRAAFAGDQIDLNYSVDPATPRVNAVQLDGGGPLVGPATPAFRWKDTDYWVQTVDIGASFNY